MDDLQTKLSLIEARLSKIEQVLQLNVTSPLAATPPSPRKAESAQTERLADHINKKITVTPTVTSPPPTKEQTNTGGKALGIVASLCFTLAAAYFIKLAVDSGWLTPLRQFYMSFLFSLSLIAVGLQLRKQDSEYSSLLPATGIVTLYLTFYAGHLYWRIYDTTAAIVLVAATSLAALWLFRIFRHAIFAFFAVAGSYLVPLLLRHTSVTQEQLATYFFIWDITFCLLAILLKERLLLAFATYFALLSFSLTCGIHFSQTDSMIKFSALFQAVQFLTFALGSMAYSYRLQVSLSPTEASSFFPLLLIFHGLEYALLEKVWPAAAPWIMLIFAATLLGLSQIIKARLAAKELPSDSTVYGYLTIVLFHSLYLEILSDDLKPLLALALVACWPLLVKNQSNKTGLLCLIPFLAGAAVIIAETAQLFFKSLDNHISGYTLTLLMLFTAVQLAGYQISKSEKSAANGFYQFLLLATGSAFMLSSLRQILLQISGSELPLLVSGVWGLYALALLLLAKQQHDLLMARCALVVFGIVSIKLFFIDLGDASAGAKIVSLLVIGSILYVGGLVYRQVVSVSDR